MAAGNEAKRREARYVFTVGIECVKGAGEAEVPPSDPAPFNIQDKRRVTIYWWGHRENPAKRRLEAFSGYSRRRRRPKKGAGERGGTAG
mgnify:CR=1 FL=1